MTNLPQVTPVRKFPIGNTITVDLDITGNANMNPRSICTITKKIGCLFLLMAMTSSVLAQRPPPDLTSASLDDLMNIEVTLVSKKEKRLFHSAAAIYVITQEDIRRSGLTSIPELLRLVPGLDVARIDGTKWAVSARGFNGRFANKLLVMIDGRSIYSQETSGVYWEAQDVLLENIERIEVIRGPGGTLWGANAVNGVINIITKRAEDTQGGLVTFAAGTEERALGSVRYGGKFGIGAYYSVRGKLFKRTGLLDAQGRDANDGQEALRVGGRIDWQWSGRDELTLDGEIYNSKVREFATNISPAAPFAPSINTRGNYPGGHLLGRWTRDFSKNSDMALQVSYDRFHRDVFDLEEVINTFDVDFQHHFALGSRSDVVWGVDYRLVADHNYSDSRGPVQITPKQKTAKLISAFVQDEFLLIKDRLTLTLGSKFEHNDYTGFELQPNIRLLWTPTARQTLWGAVSRAVRTPSRSQEGIRVNVRAFRGAGGLTNILALFGTEGIDSEDLRAHEVGYRIEAADKLSVDVATFYNSYDHLQTSEPGRPFLETDPSPSHLVIPLQFRNLMRGETYGVEASAHLSVSHNWKLRSGYSFLRMHLHRNAISRDTASEGAEGQSPRHQFQFHSFLKLPGNFDLDTSLYHVSRLPTDGIPSYTRLDARLGWILNDNVEMSVALQNLLDKQHLESFGNGVRSSEARRGAYGKLTWRF
jgi:iron complex outermembrane recepter protein